MRLPYFRPAIDFTEEAAAHYPIPTLNVDDRPELRTPLYPVDLEFARAQIGDDVVAAYPAPSLAGLQREQCYVSLSEYRVPLHRRDSRGNPTLSLFGAHRHRMWPNEGTDPDVHGS